MELKTLVAAAGAMLAAFVTSAPVALGADNAQPTVTVDWTKAEGVIKPVNGVGQGPLIGWIGTEMFAFLKEAGIPYARLHDVGGLFGGGGRFVDIPNVFPDFDADEDDPKSYEFRFTDRYLKALVDNGVEPVYRLGVTIENVAGSVGPFRVRPPKDFAKWARICEHIVRHYNEGWADGYHWNIRYWEVWNEPEDVNGDRKVLWCGTFRQYCELYEVTSKLLKEKHPNVKVGGYGGCGFYSVYGDMGHPELHERYEYFTKCFDEFLTFVRERNCPLDFFSYHSYDSLDNFRHHMTYAKERLVKYGFGDVEVSVNEWLPHSRSERPSPAARASAIAETLMAMQEGPVDSAMIYDGKCGISAYSPLFRRLDPLEWTPESVDGISEAESGIPRKAYYVYCYFNELRKLGTAVRCTLGGEPRLAAIAATDGKGEGAVLLTNPTDKPHWLKYDLQGWRTGVARYVDELRTDALTVTTSYIPPFATMLIRTSQGGTSERIVSTDGVQR